jgi:hypothetical protein
MTEYKWFRSKSTGKVGQYPAHFASRETLEEIPSEDASCLTCFIVPPVSDANELADDTQDKTESTEAPKPSEVARTSTRKAREN